MKNTIILLFVLAITSLSYVYAQTPANFNLDFENIQDGAPDGWYNMTDPYYSYGVDTSEKYSGEHSITIECTDDNPGFGSWHMFFPNTYQGTSITLSGYIKTENVSDGFAGLWMKIDPDLAFDNMQERGITGTAEWQKYEITLPLYSDNCRYITIGALMVGRGKMWLDNLSITIDGVRIEDIEPVIYPASEDKSSSGESGITVQQLNKIPVRELRELGLIWGYLKYYHPAVRSGNHNWDSELFRILPQLSEAGSRQARHELINEWIDKLGPYQYSDISEPEGDIKLYPDLEWITACGLSDELSAKLLDVKKSARNEFCYYLSFGPAGNPEFTREIPYEGQVYPDAGLRLLSLYRYWNMIQYYFPYRHLIGEDWKLALERFIPRFTGAANAEEYAFAVLELTSSINDTHAYTYLPQALTYLTGTRRSFAKISFIEDKPVVNGYYNSSIGRHSPLQAGDIILSVNDRPVNEIVEERLHRTGASNYPTKLRRIGEELLNSNDPSVKVSFLRGSEVHETDIETYPLPEFYQLSKPFNAPDSCFRMLSDEIAYLYLGNIRKSYLPELWTIIKRTKGLVIDLRCYPSEFIIFDLGRYLMPEETDFVKFTTASASESGLFVLSPILQVGEPNPDYYEGAIAILVNEETQSQAEYTAMALRAAPRAMVIGSTTAGADGNISRIILPGGFYTMISGIGVYNPDGTETQRIGIVPDIEILPTIEGIRAGKDELLEKAVLEIGNY